MLYSKGEEDDEELKRMIEPFVQPLGSAGYPIDAETGEGYLSPSDSDSVALAFLSSPKAKSGGPVAKANPEAKAKPAAKPPPAPESSEESPESPEDPWDFHDTVLLERVQMTLDAVLLRKREQEKKNRGEKHLNDVQQNNALRCLQMLEDAKTEKKGNASELLHKSSSSSK